MRLPHCLPNPLDIVDVQEFHFWINVFENSSAGLLNN